MKRYDREFLLSFADKECCRKRPEALDSSLWRDSPSPDIIEGAGTQQHKFPVRRDNQQELPEWRSRPSSNGGAAPVANQRRKTYEEEGAPNRNWAENRNQTDRPRWESRGGRGYQGAEADSRPASGRTPPEHDGLLGSGNGLRGPGPTNGVRTSDRYNGGGRGSRHNDARFTKPYRDDREDTFNGETFGDKYSDEHREEQERKRRESFENERREQQQKLKEERQKQPAEKVSTTSGMDALLEPMKISTRLEGHHEMEAAPVTPVAASRPLVPPGFSMAALHKPKKEPERIKMEDSVDKPVVLENSGIVHEKLIDPLVIEAESSLGFADTTWGSSPFIKSPFQAKASDAPSQSKLAHLFEREDGPASLNQIKPNPPQHEPTSTSSYHGRMLPMPVGPSLEEIEKSMGNEPAPARMFLTCEDIEQSLLANAENKGPAAHHVPEDDSRQHFLSLLQKGSANQRNEPPSQFPTFEAPPAATDSTGPNKEADAPTVLESLFGSSFMMELRSTDAPLSAKVAAETKYMENHRNGTKPEPIEKPPAARSRNRDVYSGMMDGVIDPSIEFAALKGEHMDNTRASNGTPVRPMFRSHSPVSAKPMPVSQVQQLLAMQASSKPSPAQVQQLLAMQGTSKPPAFQAYGGVVPPGMHHPNFPGGVMRPSGATLNGRTHPQHQQQQQQQFQYHHQHPYQQQNQQQQVFGHFVPQQQLAQGFPPRYEQQQQQNPYDKQRLPAPFPPNGSILDAVQMQTSGGGHVPSIPAYGGHFASGYMGFPGAEAGDRAATAAAQAMMQPQRMFGMNKLGFP